MRHWPPFASSLSLSRGGSHSHASLYNYMSVPNTIDIHTHKTTKNTALSYLYKKTKKHYCIRRRDLSRWMWIVPWKTRIWLGNQYLGPSFSNNYGVLQLLASCAPDRLTGFLFWSRRLDINFNNLFIFVSITFLFFKILII